MASDSHRGRETKVVLFAGSLPYLIPHSLLPPSLFPSSLLPRLSPHYQPRYKGREGAKRDVGDHQEERYFFLCVGGGRPPPGSGSGRCAVLVDCWREEGRGGISKCAGVFFALGSEFLSARTNILTKLGNLSKLHSEVLCLSV